MILSLIVAMDERGGIGKDNRLPWRLPDDLKRFKSLTMGHHMIMGRKTYESIGKPLPGRTTIIVTHNLDYQAQGCLIAHSLDQAFSIAQNRTEVEAFVIGGGNIFAQTLPHADQIYLTLVHASVDCDTFFPDLDMTKWKETEQVYYPQDDKNQFAFTFRVLKKQPAG